MIKKTEALYNEVTAFWLALPSWYIEYTMLFKYGQGRLVEKSHELKSSSRGKVFLVFIEKHQNSRMEFFIPKFR